MASSSASTDPVKGRRRAKGKSEGVVAENAGSKGGSSATSSEAGGRSEEVAGKGAPPIPSYQDDVAVEPNQVRDDMLTVRFVLDGLSFQEKCWLLRVAPRESGLCVQTAAGPGGAIVPVRVESQPDVSFAYPTSALYKQDELLSKKLQQEESDLAAHEAKLLHTDAELAKALTPNAGVQTPPPPAPHGKRRAATSTATVSITTSPADMYGPGTWGNRFAVLDACPPPSNPLEKATPAPTASGQEKASGATAAGATPARPQGNPAHAALVATTVVAATAPTPAAWEYAEADQGIGRAKRELRQAEEAKVANRKALERERAAMGRRAESLAQRRSDLVAIRKQLAASNRDVLEAEGALSGATGSYDSAHHAFVTERDRALHLNRFIPHMRTVREAPCTAMLAEGARLLSARDPPPAFDTANPTLRVVSAGRAASAAPRTEPPIMDGGGRVAYDLARPGLQEGRPGPAAVPSTATDAAGLPPAAPVLPPSAPVLPRAAPVLPLTAPVLPPVAPVLPSTAAVLAPVAPVLSSTAPVLRPAAPVLPPAAPGLPSAPAPQVAAAAPAAYDSGRLAPFLAYTITKGKNNTGGCAARLVNDYIPRWGRPHTFLSDRGAELISDVCREVFKVLGSVKKYMSSYHPQTNGMVERLNHTLCQVLSFLIADDQNKWDEMVLHAVPAHNNNVSRGTGLAPDEIHIGRYPRLPMTIKEDSGAKGHQIEKRDQLDLLDSCENDKHELTTWYERKIDY